MLNVDESKARAALDITIIRRSISFYLGFKLCINNLIPY